MEKRILFTALFLLVLAKLLPLWHIKLPEFHAYIDMDRAIALSALLTAYLSLRKPPPKTIKRFAIIFLGGLVALEAIALITPVLRELSVKLAILYVLTSFVEEIFFRGFIAEAMLRRWGKLWAGIGSSAVFALVHPAAYVFPIYGALVFLTGLLCFMFYAEFRDKWGVPEGVAVSTFAHGAVILLGMYIGII